MRNAVFKKAAFLVFGFRVPGFGFRVSSFGFQVLFKIYAIVFS